MARPPSPPHLRASERVPCYLRPVEALRLDRRRGERSRSSYLVEEAGLSRPYDLSGLTVRQPWASLLVQGRKRWENRPRALSVAPAGQWVAIHAAKRLHDDLAWAARVAPDVDPRSLPLGAIVGLAWLGPAVPLAEVEDGREWACGPLCHPVSHAIELPEPIPYSGQLGLWRVSREVVEAIEEQVGVIA